MEIPKETQCKICDWLDAKSKKISAERDSTKKKIENSKYIGGIKFIFEAGGKVVYRPKHSHSVYFDNSNEKTIINEFSTNQTIGVLQMLDYAGIITSFTDNILTIKEVLWGKF